MSVLEPQIVKNLRALYKETHDSASNLTDEQIWTIFEDYYFTSNPETNMLEEMEIVESQ